MIVFMMLKKYFYIAVVKIRIYLFTYCANDGLIYHIFSHIKKNLSEKEDIPLLRFEGTGNK